MKLLVAKKEFKLLKIFVKLELVCKLLLHR
jgi:hypothetical protein